MTRRHNSDGRPQFHLRRISHRTLSTAANNICFSNRITFVGRGDNVHYLVSSAGWQQRIFLSRRHCRLVRSEADDSHRLIDSSMTGLYVNDVKIAGSCVLEEGDVVTFGHPKGDTIQAGTRVRQPDSEHQFVFEACSCIPENPQQDVLQAGVHKRHKQLVGAAPTTPEMLGAFRVPKTVPKKKTASPAVLTQTRCTTRRSASSSSSNQTTPPSSRGRPRTRSQGWDAQNTRSRSATCPSMTRKDVGVQSSESSLESDTDTEAGFIDERRKRRVKEKPSERDRGQHVKDSHSPNPKQRVLVQSLASSTEPQSCENLGQNDVGKEVSGVDTTEEHVDEYPLDLTLKYGQTGFHNEVDQQEVKQNGCELEVQTSDGKSISTENTANNIKAAEQPDSCNQEPSIVQVTVDVQKEGIQQTVHCENDENLREESSQQPSQPEKEMDSFAEHGQENSAKEEDEESTTGTKAGIDGCSLVAPAISSKDAVENMSGHSVQSIEDSPLDKSVPSEQSQEQTPDVQGLVEDTESPNKTVEESMDMSEEKLDESTMFQTLSDNGCEEGMMNTTESGCVDPYVKAIGITSNGSVKKHCSSLKNKEIADVLKEEQEMKKTFSDELTDFPDVDATVKSPDPVEDSSAQAQDDVLVEDCHTLEKKPTTDVLTDEQEIKDHFADKLIDIDATVMSPKPVENSSIQAQDNVLVEDCHSLEKKQMADVLTDEQEIQDPFADKLTDVNAVMSSKPVEDSSVQNQDSISAANSHSLEKKEIADVLTDEQERKDPFVEKLTDVDAKVKSSKPVEDSSVQAQCSIIAEDGHSLETKEIADVLTDEQEIKDPFADKQTDEDATALSPKPMEDNSIQPQDSILAADGYSLEKKEIVDVLTDEQKIKDPFADKVTDEDAPATYPKPEDNNIQSQDDRAIFDTTVLLAEDTHPVLREDKPSVAGKTQTCRNKTLVEESETSVDTGSLYQTLASVKNKQALEDTNKVEQDLSPSNPSNQTEEKDNGVKIDESNTSSQSEDKTLPELERDVTNPIVGEPTLLKEEDLKSPVKLSESLKSPEKSDPPCNKSAIDDTALLMLEEDTPVTDGMEKEENDEEIILSHTSQGSSIPPSPQGDKSDLQVKDGSDHSVSSSEPTSVDDEDPSISPSSPVIDQLHDTSTLNAALDDSTAWVLEELEDLEVSPEIPPLSKDGNTKDASQDLPQQPSICDVPSILENETEKEMIPSSQGSNREYDSGESSGSHMGMLRLSPSGKSGINASQSESDVENKDVETPLSQNSTGSDFGLSGIVPFLASPTGSQDDSCEALYSKVVAEIQANEDIEATPTHFRIQDQEDARDDNVTTGLKKSVTFEVKDSGLDTDSKENDDLRRDELGDNFSDRDSRFMVSDSIDYRADDDNYSSDSESSSSDEEDPSNVGGAGLGLHLSDSEGEAEERRHSSQSVSQHKEHSSFGHHVKDQSKDVTEIPEESNEGKKENKFSDPVDIEDVLSDNFQETSTQLAKSEEGRKEVLQLEEKSADETSLSKDLPSQDASTGKLHNISKDEEEYVAKARSEEGRKEVLQLEEMPADDTTSSKDMPSQDAGTGKLPHTSEDEEDVAKDMEAEPQMVTSEISMEMESSSSQDQLNQDGESDSEHDISKPHTSQAEELRPKRQLNTKSEDESANETLLCADNVEMHSHVQEENSVIDGQPCEGGAVVMQSAKRPHDENDTALPHNKRLHLDAQLEETDNTEAEECTLMDVLSEECENIPEDSPCAIEDNFDVQCEETKNKDTAHFEQKSLPLILVKSRAECVRDVVLDFFANRFFVNNVSSKLDKIAEDNRKQKVAEEVKTFFASGVWKEQPTTRPKDGSVEPTSEIASDNNSSAKEEEVLTCENIQSLEVDKRKVIEDAVYDFFKMKNFASTKMLDSGTEDTGETETKAQMLPNKRRNNEEQMLGNVPEAKRQKLQEVSEQVDDLSSKNTPKINRQELREASQYPDVGRNTTVEVNSSREDVSLSENQDCKTFADIQEDSMNCEVKANQDEQNPTLGQDEEEENRDTVCWLDNKDIEAYNANNRDSTEIDASGEMSAAAEEESNNKDGHELQTSTEQMDIQPEQHNDKEMVDLQDRVVQMEVCLSTESDSKASDQVATEDEKNNCLSSASLSAEENIETSEESIEESPAQASEKELVVTKNLSQDDLSENAPLTASPKCQTSETANNKDFDEIIPDTATSGSPNNIKDGECQDLTEVPSKGNNEMLQSKSPAIEETSREKPCSRSPVDNTTSSDSKEPGQTSQDNKVPEVCNDVVVQEDSETDNNSESSLPSLDGYSDSESDRDSNYSENDRFLSSNSMEYGAESMQYGAESLEYGTEFDSDENEDDSDQDDEEDDSSEDEDDDDDDDDDANSEEDEDKDSYSSATESPTSSTAKKTNASSKECPDTEQALSVKSSKATASDKLGDGNEDVTKVTEKQSNEMSLEGLSCDFDDDDEFSAPHINIDDIDFDDDNFDDPSMQTSSNLHSPTTNFSLGKDVSGQEKRNMAAVKASEMPELEKSKKMANVAAMGDNLGLGTSQDSAGNTATKPPANKPTNVSSGKETTDKTLGVGEDKENPVAQTTEETPGVLPTNAGRTRRHLVDTPGKVTTDNAPRYMEQCQTILASLQGALDREPSLKDISRVQAWKKEAAKLGEKMSLPETIIAVVGDTGAGKSSLMNALLDQSSVLPTSGMRACTAVVVEVSNNDKNKNYEAQVEFLSRKEWDDELRLLLTDLIGEDGKAKRKPDPQSEAGIAWSKIKAVYGRVESYDILSKLPHVRHLLGSTKHISKSRAREFRSEIDRYVDSMDAPPARGPGSRDRSGGQLWPIVKRVKVQIPNCDVCSSGAILVDLPGVRDSNAARDNIAKQYFKNCNAIWIVASIHRAVDDKTAKELLGEGFRRQLLMDGQYGSIAFICTKTDDLRCSEIIRALNLEEEVEQLENEINALEMEKMSLTEDLESLREEEEVTDEELSVIQQKVNDLKEKVFELEQALEPIDETSDEEVIVDDDDRVKLNSLRTSMEDRQQIEQETKTSLKEIRSQIADKEKEMAGIERQVSKKQKQMSVMCAKARNQYSQTQIRADFKAGIREMKRKAGMMGEDADSDDDEEEAGDQEEEDIARGLKVFTVSSTEYLKLTNKLTRDGPAQVFSNVQDTQIPALREFVHEITNVRRESGTEKLIRSLGSFVSDIASYLLDEGTKNHGTRMSAKSIFEHHLGQLKTSLQPVLGTLQTDVDRSISICIHPKLKEGVQAAATMCQAVAKKWGAPTCKENRQAGGLHYSTYKATVRRSGVYKSPTYGPIDMNEDLSSPLYNTITISWQKVFDNGTLFFTLDNCKHSILSTLKEFLLKLRTELQALGMDADRVNRVGQQQLNSTKMRLDNTLAELKEFITAQQREISRVMTPAVQNRMEPAYETCTNERGPGSFNRMRNHMDVHVVYEKDIMFDQASQVLLKQLADLEVDIVARMQVLCDQLCADLAVLYEPFWEAPVHCTILKKHLMDDMLAIHGKVKSLFKEAELKDLPPLPEPAPQPAALNQSATGTNYSLMNTPGTSYTSNRAIPSGSNPVTRVTPTQPLTHRMKQELVDMHSYGGATPPTQRYQFGGATPPTHGYHFGVRSQSAGTTSGPSFSGVRNPVTGRFQSHQASASTYTSQPRVKREESPQVGYLGAFTPLLNPTAVNQFRKRTLQGMEGPGNSQATVPPVLKKVKTEEGCFVTMMGQGGQVVRFPVVQTMTQLQHNSSCQHSQQTGAAASPFMHRAATPGYSQSLPTTTKGSHGGNTGRLPSTQGFASAKSGKTSASTYSTGKSVTSQGLSSANAKVTSSKSQTQSSSSGQTGLIGKKTPKKGGKGKGPRVIPATVPAVRQQVRPAVRVKQEPRSPLRENQRRKKRKFQPDEIIDLTLGD